MAELQHKCPVNLDLINGALGLLHDALHSQLPVCKGD